MQCMWILSTNDAWKNRLVKNLKTENFSVSKFLTKFFFMHHLCLGFTCIALIFGIYLAVLQSYLWLFSHITYKHFTKLGTQLDLKIDWLIFWVMYFLVYAFLCVNCRKYFFLRDMMDNQCANIFSTYATVYGSHSVMFAFYWKREYFSSCVSST